MPRITGFSTRSVPRNPGAGTGPDVGSGPPVQSIMRYSSPLDNEFNERSGGIAMMGIASSISIITPNYHRQELLRRSLRCDRGVLRRGPGVRGPGSWGQAQFPDKKTT